MELTEQKVTDGKILTIMIEGRKDLVAVSGDGAYDKKRCYDAIVKCNAQAIIPPRSGACLTVRHYQITPGLLERNKIVKIIWKDGRKEWKLSSR